MIISKLCHCPTPKIRQSTIPVEKIKSSVNKCGKFEDYGRKRSTEIGKKREEERAQEK